MSKLTDWWENHSLREKAILLSLLILINLALILQLDANPPPISSLPTTSLLPAPAEKKAAASELTAKTPTARTLSPSSESRDPFRPPAGLKPIPVRPEEPAQPTGTQNNTVASVAPSKAKADAVVIAPVLTGIMTDGSDKRLAIIEYDGNSRYYHLYDAIGPFTLTDIGADQVTLSGPDKSLQLALRR